MLYAMGVPPHRSWVERPTASVRLSATVTPVSQSTCLRIKEHTVAATKFRKTTACPLTRDDIRVGKVARFGKLPAQKHEFDPQEFTKKKKG